MELLHQFHSFEADIPLIVLRVFDLEFRPHWHSEVELLYVISGSLKVSANYVTRQADPGSLVVCGSRSIHSYERVTRRSETIVVLFRPEIIGNRPAWPMAGRLGEPIASRADHPELSRRAESIALELLAEMEGKGAGYNSVARGYVLQLCGLIERELASSAPAAAEEASASGVQERLQKAIDFIHENALRPIPLEEAAGVAALSPCYFSRVFKRIVGTSFKTFVNEVRIERAENLMANTSMTLADIAQESGFDDLRTFNRVFRAIRDATPSEERARFGRAPLWRTARRVHEAAAG